MPMIMFHALESAYYLFSTSSTLDQSFTYRDRFYMTRRAILFGGAVEI